MSKGVTQREIADLLGISYLTVNRVLSASGRSAAKVHPATRNRIQEAARRLGYRRNVMASNLALKRTSSIGVVWPHRALSYYLEVVSALEQVARSHGYQVVIAHRAMEGAGSEREIRFLSERMVDGLIVAPDQLKEPPSAFKLPTESSIPTLLFNSFVPGIQGHYLGTDSRQGAIAACRYLLDLGHRRLAFVSGPRHEYTSRCREEGVRTAVTLAGLPENALSVIEGGGFTVEAGERAAERLRHLSTQPTAVLAANDALAIGVFLALRRAGVQIPRDISLCGYAGMWEGELLSPPLTTVRQPVRKLGRRAAELIIDFIHHSEPSQAATFEELPDELVVRASCAPPATLQPQRGT